MQLLDRLEVTENRHLPWTTDLILPTVMWVALALPGITDGVDAFLASSMLIAPLVLRRRYPLLMLFLMTLAGLYMVLASRYPLPAIAAVPVAVYSIARWVPGLQARSSVIVGGLASVIGPARWVLSSTQSPSQITIAFGLTASMCLGIVLTPYVLGRRVRDNALAKRAEQDAVADRYQRALQAREQSARMAEGRARAEIARELHDIVAHSLSVMIVQAEGGKAMAQKRPEKAEEVLGTIAETGREALSEMRRIVGVLRSDDTPNADYTPTPGLADLPEMIARAGDRVSYSPPTHLPIVPTTLGLTTYRIVQESVTNFLKHAGPESHATVVLQATPRYLRVQVSDDGLGASAGSDGAGSGLKGMRERVATMGGQLVAGAKPDGGFEVTALLPLPVGGPPRQYAGIPQGFAR